MVIHSESESETESDDLLDALEERLCGDLGLKPDWSRWTDDGWPEPDESPQHLRDLVTVQPGQSKTGPQVVPARGFPLLRVLPQVGDHVRPLLGSPTPMKVM